MIPWINYDASSVIDADQRRRERNKNLLTTAASAAMGMKAGAAANLLKQRELDQRASEHAGKMSLDQQHLDFQKQQHDESRTTDAAYALSKARNMMTPGHPDYNPDGARALLKAYGFDVGGGMDPDALLPMGGQ